MYLYCRDEHLLVWRYEHLFVINVYSSIKLHLRFVDYRVSSQRWTDEGTPPIRPVAWRHRLMVSRRNRKQFYHRSLTSRSCRIWRRERMRSCALVVLCFATERCSTCIEVVTPQPIRSSVRRATTWPPTGTASRHTSSVTGPCRPTDRPNISIAMIFMRPVTDVWLTAVGEETRYREELASPWATSTIEYRSSGKRKWRGRAFQGPCAREFVRIVFDKDSKIQSMRVSFFRWLHFTFESLKLSTLRSTPKISFPVLKDVVDFLHLFGGARCYRSLWT